MDYSCRVVIGVLLGLCAIGTQAAADKPLLPVSAHWLHENSALEHIASVPSECLNPAAPVAVVLGRLAFESPALLGGQSARMGLSCSACHLSARSNPHFYLEGISGAAGTADVSQSFLSSSGGNDDFSPKIIPDLAVYNQRGIKDRTGEAFRAKLRQLIEVEFDGQAALPVVFDALTQYLINIDQRYCSSLTADVQRSWRTDWLRLYETTELLAAAFKEEDRDLTNFLIRVGRYRLENVYRAVGLIDHRPLKTKLVESSRSLAALARMTKQQQLSGLAQWRQQSMALTPLLEQVEPKSAYNRQALQRLAKKL